MFFHGYLGSMRLTRNPPAWKEDTLRPPFFVVSDTHWFHRNIIRYSGRPDNHDRIMVERWNDVVGDDDVVLHLGDLFMWPNKYERFKKQVASKLKGEKYIILGNHDDKKLDYKGLGFTPIEPFRMRWSPVDPHCGYRPDICPYGDDCADCQPDEHWVEFDHYPSDGMMPGYLRVHGHIHTNGYGTLKGPHVASRLRNVNVSVEVIDYTPQPIEKILKGALG